MLIILIQGVKVYDVIAKRRITFIKRDHDEKLRTELYRCNLCWKDKTTLLVGWADRIKVNTFLIFFSYNRELELKEMWW